MPLQNASLVCFEDLKELLGYQRQVDIEKCLRRQGIAYFYARAGVWTTVDLVNAAGGLRQPTAAAAYLPSDIF